MALTISEIAATTLERRSGKIVDNVIKNNALWAQLNMDGRIRPVSGGRVIWEELSYAENPNAGWYSGYDPLPTASFEALSAAEYAWKQLAAPVTISGLEEIQNAGDAAVIDLLPAKLDVTESTMVNLASQAVYSDGTGSGGKQLAGLDLLVPVDPTVGSVGGISRVTELWWRSQVLDPAATPTTATIGGHMTTLYLMCSLGNMKPNLIMADNVLGAMYINSLQPQQRFTDSRLANLGFENVKFMGASVVIDGGIGGFAAASTMYFLNTKFLSLRPSTKRNMVPLKRRQPVNQDASVEMLVWAGALTMSQARVHGRLIGT